MASRPNCYMCEHRRNLQGDSHSRCLNEKANVVGVFHGIQSGWFYWPENFDPDWLESCDGFKRAETKHSGVTPDSNEGVAKHV